MAPPLRTPRDLPAVSQTVSPLVRDPLVRTIEEVQRLLGFRGDPLDKAITYREGQRLGWVDGPPSGGPGFGWGGGGGGGGDPTEPDPTPPPTPTGLTGTGGFTNIILVWDAPTYTEGHGNAQTNIYAVKRPIPDPGAAPTFADAQVVSNTFGATNVTAIPSELNTRWHVWIKWKSVDGFESVDPAGGINGLIVQTGQDINQLLLVLTNKITRSQLFSDIGAPIDLINAPSNVPGSVNFRIATTAADLTSSFTAADNTVAANAQTYVQNYAYSKSTVDGAFTSQFNALTANYQAADGTLTSNLTAYVGNYTYAKAAIDGAIASASTTLSAAFALADQTVLTTAANYTNNYAYALANGNALSSSVASLSASVNLRPGGSALNSDPYCRRPDQWEWGAHGSTVSFGEFAWGQAGPFLMFGGPGPSSAQAKYGASTVTGRRYRISALVNRGASANGTFFLRYVRKNSSDAVVQEMTGSVEAVVPPAETMTRYSWEFVATSDDKFVSPRVILNWTGTTGFYYAQDIRIDDVTDAVTLTAALQQEASVRANVDGALLAQATVKIDLNGYVTGYGLASTLINGTPSSSFIIRADRFAVASPSGPGIAPIVPFSVVTVPFVESGVNFAPGIYADAAIFRNLDALTARFGVASIDDAKIASLTAAKITAGSMQVGSYIQSTGYTGVGPNSWRLDASGTLFASAAVIYGTVYAGAGTIGGITIGANSVYSSNYVAGSSGWRIHSDGSADFESVTIRTGSGAIGGNVITPTSVYSPGFTSGGFGWTINNNGTAEFQSIVARGTIHASAGTIGGITVGSTYLRSSNYVPASTGFTINTNGTADFAGGVTFGGTLVAASGSLGSIVVGSGGFMRMGQPSYNTGVGFWFGDYGGGNPALSMRDSSGRFITLDPVNGIRISSDVLAPATGPVSVSVDAETEISTGPGPAGVVYYATAGVRLNPNGYIETMSQNTGLSIWSVAGSWHSAAIGGSNLGAGYKFKVIWDSATLLPTLGTLNQELPLSSLYNYQLSVGANRFQVADGGTVLTFFISANGSSTIVGTIYARIYCYIDRTG